MITYLQKFQIILENLLKKRKNKLVATTDNQNDQLIELILIIYRLRKKNYPTL